MSKEYERSITVLGSVKTLGPVLLYDEMESLLKWSEAGQGGDTTFEKCDTVAYNGTSSLHMKTRTTGATLDDDISGWRDFFKRPGKRYRMECLFMPDVAVQSRCVYFEVKMYDAVGYHRLGVRWDEVNAIWQYIPQGGVWTNVPGGSQVLTADQFNRVMFEWDESTNKYIRLVSGGLEVDLSTIPYHYAVSPAAEVARLDIGMLAGVGPPGEVYFDDVLVMEI